MNMIELDNIIRKTVSDILAAQQVTDTPKYFPVTSGNIGAIIAGLSGGISPVSIRTPTGRTATYVIAAYNATALEKASGRCSVHGNKR
jgi:hypothetical protein